MVKFGYTILYVDDVEATLSFYENAFGFIRKFCTPEKDYGELISGETTLAFASITLGNSNLKNGITPIRTGQRPSGFEVCLITEKIEETIENALNAGAKQLEESTVKPWGQTVAYLQDINGFLLEICTPIE